MHTFIEVVIATALIYLTLQFVVWGTVTTAARAWKRAMGDRQIEVNVHFIKEDELPKGARVGK